MRMGRGPSTREEPRRCVAAVSPTIHKTRLSWLAGVLCLLGLSLPAMAEAQPIGSLTQAPGPAGCISERSSGGDCIDGKSLDDPVAIAVSADGKSVYVASAATDGVAVLRRNVTTGALIQSPGPSGCISERGSGGDCIDGKALDDPTSLAVSPNGKSVYVTSSASDGVAVLARNTTNGVLSQAAGPAGCISERSSGGDCVDGKALDDPTSVAVTNDGKSVYVTSAATDGVAVLRRNITTGVLSQAAGVAGCISERSSGGDCIDGKALDDPLAVAVSADGRSAYVTSSASDGVAVLARNITTGALGQAVGLNGCISERGSGGDCVDGKALDDPVSVVVSRDGKSVYVTSAASDGVAVLRRHTA
jgi:DNA-binding beta-propeller fold protein YncE